MSFLSQAWDNITNKVSEHFEKKKQEQEEFEAMRRQAEFQRRIQLEQETKEKELLAAKQDALNRAQKKTGIQKLRALNRAQRLEEGNQNAFFSKLSEHTRKNRKRTEENKRRSQLIRDEAKRMREEKLRQRQLERLEKMRNRRW